MYETKKTRIERTLKNETRKTLFCNYYNLEVILPAEQLTGVWAETVERKQIRSERLTLLTPKQQQQQQQQQLCYFRLIKQI